MRIVLAYSGSLEGAAAIGWLRARHGAEVIAVTLDLGQGRELEAVRDRALGVGAGRAHVLDARDDFAHHYALPALQADALHDGRVPMARALSRPLIAQRIVEIAAIEHADAVAHTGTPSGGASPLDRLLASLAPELHVLTPARDRDLSAQALAAFARSRGFAVAGEAARADANIWGRSIGLRDASAPPPPAAAAPAVPPGEPACIDIAFARGVPTALNGVPLPLVDLVSTLDMLTTAHGVGRGAAGTLWCEAPAAVLLHAALRALTRAVWDDGTRAFSAEATSRYVRLVEDAAWFSPLRAGLDAYFSSVQSRVNGHVRLRVFDGAYSTITTEHSGPAPASAPPRGVPSSAQH